jgi:hypothetical protein
MIVIVKYFIFITYCRGSLVCSLPNKKMQIKISLTSAVIQNGWLYYYSHLTARNFP